MSLRRIPVDPASFAAIDRGDQLALVLVDDGLRAGDELFVERSLGGVYQGGAKLLRVTHVERHAKLADGYCIVTARRIGLAERVA
jgi:hypothetical protein